MSKIYKTAMGKQIDIDSLQSQNEHVIAVGNRNVNARGDQLGAGGKVVKTRDAIMKEYYSLNTPVAVDPTIPVPVQPVTKPVAAPISEVPVINPESGLDEFDYGPAAPTVPQAPVSAVLAMPTETPAPVVIDQVVAPAVLESAPAPAVLESAPVEPPIRGSLADAVAKNITVTQTPMLPPKKAAGIQRF